MAKHVYPPWYNPVQKVLFVIAAILCIVLPVVYGEARAISSTSVIVVLVLYFAAWATFSVRTAFDMELMAHYLPFARRAFSGSGVDLCKGKEGGTRTRYWQGGGTR
jgi:hypothetical protein